MTNRVVVISGGSRGIGLAISKRHADAGDQVYTLNLSPAKNILYNNITEIQCDIRNKNSVENNINLIFNETKKIDILINCAGIQQNQNNYLEDITEDDWHSVIDTNLNGTFHLSKSVIPIMKKRKSGVIINIGSVAATDGYPKSAAYATSKSALIGLTKTMAKELAPFNIRVNMIMPSLTMTDAARALPVEVIDKLINLVPLGRVANPEDIAGVEFFLSSSDANYITGELVRVAGGR